MKLSNDELILLSHLRDDARVSLAKIGSKTNMPLSTIYEKLRQFERDFIKKHTCLLDFKKMGYGVKVSIALKVKKEHREGLYNFLMDSKHINNFHKINSGYDFMVEGVFKDYYGFKEFMERIEEEFTIEEKQVFHLIEDVKEQGFMAAEQDLQ